MFLDFFFWNADLYSLRELPIKARRREEKRRGEVKLIPMKKKV
jgi:hypothetical protein